MRKRYLSVGNCHFGYFWQMLCFYSIIILLAAVSHWVWAIIIAIIFAYVSGLNKHTEREWFNAISVRESNLRSTLRISNKWGCKNRNAIALLINHIVADLSDMMPSSSPIFKCLLKLEALFRHYSQQAYSEHDIQFDYEWVTIIDWCFTYCFAESNPNSHYPQGTLIAFRESVDKFGKRQGNVHEIVVAQVLKLIDEVIATD